MERFIKWSLLNLLAKKLITIKPIYLKLCCLFFWIFFCLFAYYYNLLHYNEEYDLCLDIIQTSQKEFLKLLSKNIEYEFEERSVSGAHLRDIESEIVKHCIKEFSFFDDGEIFFYNKDYMIYDQEVDKTLQPYPLIKEVFNRMIWMGAKNVQELYEGITCGSSGSGWYIWSPSVGKRYLTWRSFPIKFDNDIYTYTIGISISEREFFNIFRFENKYRNLLYRIIFQCFTGLIGLIFFIYIIDQFYLKQKILESELDAKDKDLESYVYRLKKTIRQLEIAKREAEAANKIKTNFLANMSHELRTPLNGVFGVVELINHTQDEEKRRGYIDTAKSTIRNLFSLIEDILDLSKLESDKVDVSIKPVNTRNLVKTVVNVVRFHAQEKNLSLETIFSDLVPDEVLTDSNKIKQILLNLLTNAIKFTNTGTVELHLDYIHDVLIFTVTDTGIGIAEEDIDKIFDSFSRVENTYTVGIIGTGLGLSICKKTVELLNGYMNVYSEPGIGTTFEVAIPVITIVG
jgi:signal transduction histidine kinase